jgi:hypothetical protein
MQPVEDIGMDHMHLDREWDKQFGMVNPRIVQNHHDFAYRIFTYYFFKGSSV